MSIYVTATDNDEEVGQLLKEWTGKDFDTPQL